MTLTNVDINDFLRIVKLNDLLYKLDVIDEYAEAIANAKIYSITALRLGDLDG